MVLNIFNILFFIAGFLYNITVFAQTDRVVSDLFEYNSGEETTKTSALHCNLEVYIQAIQPVSCHGATDAFLMANVPEVLDTLSYIWNNGQDYQVAEFLGVGTYSVTVSDEHGCEVTTSFYLEEPDPFFVGTTITNALCAGNNVGTIKVDSVSGGQGDYLFSLDGSQFSSTSFFNNLEAGEHQLFVQDEAGCVTVVPLVIETEQEIFIDLGPDQTIQLGEQITLSVYSDNDHLVYFWPHNNTVSPQVIVSPLVSTIYAVRAVDTISLCEAETAVKIKIAHEQNVFIPSAFSPNNDGVNDVFFPFVSDGIRNIKRMQIFNRYGGLVFDKTNLIPDVISLGWDGTYRGQHLNEGVFLYFIDLEFDNGHTATFKGDFSLIR